MCTTLQACRNIPARKDKNQEINHFEHATQSVFTFNFNKTFARKKEANGEKVNVWRLGAKKE